MKIKGIMMRKEPQFKLHECSIEKLVVLPEPEYCQFCTKMLADYDFIAENRELMYAEGVLGAETYHCLLVMGEDSEDGVLVESEGAGYARYASYQPYIKSYLREQLRMAADDILRGEMGKQADGSWLIGWDDIKEHLDITVSRTNGIGQLLVEELNRREEVAEAIATEDGMEMSMILARNQNADGMDLFSVMECNLTDVCLCHEKENGYNEVIAKLNPNTLTAEGRKEWSDILSAKVTSITPGGAGIHVTLSGCEAQRISDFAGMLAGYCQVEEYERWVRDEGRNYAQAASSQKTDSITRKVNLIATYEELLGIPKEQRITHYFGDYGEHFFNQGVTEEEISKAYHKALDVIGMEDMEFQEPGNGFMYRGEVIARMRDCLLQKELKLGEQVLFVATQPYGGPGDFAFRGGIVESVDTWKKTCSVRSDFFTMDDVPLHYVLGRYNPDIREKHYGKECVEPLFGEHEALAQQYLREAEEDWNERWEESESQSDGMGMNL